MSVLKLKIKSLVSLLLAMAGPCAGAPVVIKVGHFPNLTQPQAVVAHGFTREGKGWMEERLGQGVEVQWYIYNGGPSVMEALMAGSIDLAYVGPSPTINAFVRTQGKQLKVVAGACSGGAALVVKKSIEDDKDFKGKKVATPQLGNTQDVAARTWLRERGYKFTLAGGEVKVVPTPHADQFALFQRNQIHAAWTVEPWVTRMVKEGNGKIFLEESELWKETGGKYVTTHLVASEKFIRARPKLLEKFLLGHVELTQWILDHPQEAMTRFNREMKAETTRSISEEVLTEAWKRIEVTYDPVRSSLLKSAEDARKLGFLKQKTDLSKIYDLELLNKVLKEKNLPELK